ncbi:CDC45-like protein-domain-containing protein [Fomitopsis serialis]|uniref:CDC45-like protein-domain-containing protein n=1 Tax=Fomitopsis serialis TaxID=139415 RepID=UPI0020085BB6|nr:CDC45-like protein-domain-containing protein [Neoantrodia serialis]KAH9934679.1 CDC45-like protein-domain-containing protein [Neoantrodia serialis]
MVYLPPPHLASETRPSYGETYAKILATHRRSPTTSASSVIILVAPDVDALCAAQMLAELFKQDDVMYRIIPVVQLHTLLLLNMGAILDLPSSEWFGDFDPRLTVHVIDSSRPQNLRRRVAEEDEDEESAGLRVCQENAGGIRGAIGEHYMSGTWHGQSASGTIYILATVLERVDNDLLWLAVLVARLNPPPPASAAAEYDFKPQNPDDTSVYASDELRFTMFRHWNVYDAMYHSYYFSIPETQQPYSHMAKDLKLSLRQKLDQIAPEYGLVELSYPPYAVLWLPLSSLSAADAVEAVSALLDVAGGVRMEVEVEGARNGGEWFGGGRVWNGAKEGRRRDEERENIPPGGAASAVKTSNALANVDGKDDGGSAELQWWVKNFWTAFDALNDIVRLREALPLAMALHRAIMRQGSSIIDKHDIRTLRGHRVVILSQGPDLALFAHPGVLSRLALWLVEALRDRLAGTQAAFSRSKRKSLPLVLACMNEREGTYIVVGVMGALDYGDVRKNEFGLAFLDAKERCNARTRHGSFDTSVLEINKDDLKVFLETLCERH